MSEKKRPKYMSKSVKFGGKEMTLYSLDGTTWSTRRDELSEIMTRHEQERLKSMQSMGEALSQPEDKSAAPAATEEEGEAQDGNKPKETDEEEEDDVTVDEDVDADDLPDTDDEEEEEVPAERLKAKKAPVMKEKPMKVKAKPAPAKVPLSKARGKPALKKSTPKAKKRAAA